MRKVFYNKLLEAGDFQKKEEQVETCWAMFSRDADGRIDVEDWHFGKLQKVAKEVVPFVEDGLTGWKLMDGSLVVPAWFDQIELTKYFLYLHHDDRYTTVSTEQLIPGRQDEQREYYVENGLLGLRDPKTDEYLTPADGAAIVMSSIQYVMVYLIISITKANQYLLSGGSSPM